MLLHRSQVRLLRFWEARNVRRRGVIRITTGYIEAILIPVGGMSNARLDVVWDPLNEVGLEKLWLVVVTMRSMLDLVKTNKEKANKKKKDKKEESLMN
ncbi:hypothetical protein F2Q68_00044520 [Brassica cretica]|uniref:Uncharacterized protein n=1 Tax=Brassica cretica TaxID=69181 RepID=A0A8S9LIM8_BRACR|nr:hypothetical protein F2Q68_00044520 [Brassica cretica]